MIIRIWSDSSGALALIHLQDSYADSLSWGLISTALETSGCAEHHNTQVTNMYKLGIRALATECACFLGTYECVWGQSEKSENHRLSCI